jgi:hypothetical protein
MAFDKKAWTRIYMRDYRAGRHRRRKKVRPGYFDKKAWSRVYMRPYMQRVRARQKLERDRKIAAMALRSSATPSTRNLSANDRLANLEKSIADMAAMLALVKSRLGVRS